MTSTVSWNGHVFNVHLPEANWNSTAGVYIFTGLNRDRKWVPIYIGQATSLADRLSGHEQWAPAVRLGATHIHAKAVSLQSERDSIEKSLIKAFQPHLNVQLK